VALLQGIGAAVVACPLSAARITAPGKLGDWGRISIYANEWGGWGSELNQIHTQYSLFIPRFSTYLLFSISAAAFVAFVIIPQSRA